MAAPERLQVGAVGERHLDLHEHVARAGPRVGHVLEAEVAGAVEARRPHGTNTTFSAVAGAKQVEALVEALERQHRRLGQVELGEQRDCRAHVPPASPSASPTTVSSRR